MDHSSKDWSAAVVVVDVAAVVHDVAAVLTWLQQSYSVHWTEEHRRIGFCWPGSLFGAQEVQLR